MTKLYFKSPSTVSISLLMLFFLGCHYVNGQNNEIQGWVTKADRSALLQPLANTISFKNKPQDLSDVIMVDPSLSYQSLDGFGFALTGGSAELLTKMDQAERSKILQELFGKGNNDISISYIRLTIGASDLNSFVFSYVDLKDGDTDFKLKKFSLSQDLKDVVPVMKEILAINPNIEIMASPWSAPTWMKTNNHIHGGKLKPDCYEVYAQYFVKYIQAMKKEGIDIHAVTIQNEPMNSGNTPSMSWFVNEQADFVKNHLGPAFKAHQLSTKIIVFDHNTDRPDFPLAIYNDPDAAQYVDGAGFHNYRGNMESMSLVHLARPDKNIYFTEQMLTENPESQEIKIAAASNRLIVGPLQNWSRNIILWNLAADPQNDPHTDNGGCPFCQGAITLDGNEVRRNIAYYTIGHVSKFVAPGSSRIYTTTPGAASVRLYQDEQRPDVYRTALIENSDVLPNVAFSTPEGGIVLLVVNNSWDKTSFQIQYRGRYAKIELAPGSVGTYIWKEQTESIEKME